MKLKKSLALLALSFGLISTATTQAAVINFDDLPYVDFSGTIENGYQGFDWSSFAYINKFAMPNTGFEKGVVSGQHGAYNDFAGTSTTSGNLFDFNGAYLTAGWKDGLIIEVSGSANGITQYNKTVTVNTSQAQWFDFNFFDIDSLTFWAYGGTRNPDLDNDGEFFILDNFTYNEPRPTTEVSEPSSLMLLGLGIILLGVISQGRKRS